MSSEEEQADEVCASCGKAEVDDIKLKICTACKLVKYCSVACQKNHRKQHKKACKKRAAEIKDDRLFKHPDGCCYGECPICCLSLPLDLSKSTLNSCCCQTICVGCEYANKIREAEQGLEHKCPYCREAVPKSDEDMDKNYMERAKANDPEALNQLGKKRQVEGDYEGAFEYWTKAAALGDVVAQYQLSVMYDEGDGVDKDINKQLYHLEEAAIGGHPSARYNLGIYEKINGRFERARKHFIIAANLGDHDSLNELRKLYANGHASKEDYFDALRAYQTAVDATKSPERKEAEEAIESGY